MEALKRCFPDLLATRNARYHKLAHFVIDYRELREPSFTGRMLLDMVRNKVPSRRSQKEGP